MARSPSASKLSRIKNGRTVSIVAALACTVIGGYEGYSAVAYKDIIGVWTACYGETRGIRAGMKFTKAECDKMFLEGLNDFAMKMEQCVPSMADEAATPPTRYVAHLSLAYNIGTGAYCKSSIARKQNAGDVKGACEAFNLYNRAGGRVIRGLVLRRADERQYCLKGL
jgi:lysozyme